MSSGPAPVAPSSPRPDVSIVVPVFNEEGSAGPLAREIASAFAPHFSYETIFVDDASRDGTAATLQALAAELPGLRVLRHAMNAGQSSAVRNGVVAARAPLVVTLDGDGQNDPADAPRLLRRLIAGSLAREGTALGLVGGVRGRRRDSAAKRYGSWLANAVRRRLLNDASQDTGCGLKAFRRDAFLALPYFDHMHRYLPALMLREGYAVAFEEVGHRPRLTGTSKYTNLGRLSDAGTDLAGVLWLGARTRAPERIDVL